MALALDTCPGDRSGPDIGIISDWIDLMTRLLDSINDPADLKGLSKDELTQVAGEVREQIVATIPQIGGHFSSNLGTVELSVALHHVFDSPWDRIVWDVGHQA